MNTLKKLSLIGLLISIIFCFSACYEPCPLYGTWADNQGSKIVFINDFTFTATITDSTNVKTIYDGDYNVLANSLVFTTSSGRTMVTEWDIRGNMLYLFWTDEDKELTAMTLYKTAN